MSKKRGATTELNHDNWEQVLNNDDEAEQQRGAFSVASKEQLAGRKIRTAKRRMAPGEQAPKGSGIFSGFAGFGGTPTSKSSVGTSSQSKALTQLAKTDGGKPVQTSTPLTAPSTAKRTNLVGSCAMESPEMTPVLAAKSSSDSAKSTNAWSQKQTYLDLVKTLNTEILAWASRHVAENPFVDLRPTFQDYAKNFVELEAKCGFGADPSSTNGQANKVSRVEPQKQPPPTFSLDAKPKLDFADSALSKSPSNGDGGLYKFGAASNNKNGTDKSDKQRGEAPKFVAFNATSTSTTTTGSSLSSKTSSNFGAAQQKSSDFASAFTAAAAAAKSNDKDVGKPQEKRQKSDSLFGASNKSTAGDSGALFKFGGSSTKDSSAAPNTTTSASTTTGLFKFGGGASSSNSNEPKTTSSSSDAKSTPFTFGAKASETDSASKSAGGGGLFKFGGGNSTGGDASNTPLFAFKPSTSAGGHHTVDNTFTTSGGGTPSESAAKSQPFSFASAIQQNKQQTTTSADDDDKPYEPPKAEDAKHNDEAEAYYHSKCKLFYMDKSGSYVDKGVGVLYLKSLAADKSQLLIRANTTTGTILLNVALQAGQATKRVGKNNVSLLCVPNPPLDEDDPTKPAVMLIRVKTDADADKLLKIIDDAKVGKRYAGDS